MIVWIPKEFHAELKKINWKGKSLRVTVDDEW